MVQEVFLEYMPLGGCRKVIECRDPEVLACGPSGTGKTRAVLEKVHRFAGKYAGCRILMVRKTHADLTATALQTYAKKVLNSLDPVSFYGGSAKEPPQFRYANGSVICIGGMDRPTKILSSEYDLAFVNEATELSENDWEMITTRLRNWKAPYQQIIGDCNPDAPHHWLKVRADLGRTTLITSTHEDNPELWDWRRSAWTERGSLYMAKLEALSGVRYLRYRKGIWAAAEGLVYDDWDINTHVVDRPRVPDSWERLWSVDFGYTHPFVWQDWAIDPDGRLYRVREIYMTGRLVEDHAALIKRLTAYEPRPSAVVCDHDAEDRATLERHLGLSTVAAKKDVRPGIEAVKARMRKAGDGRARIFFCRGALAEIDLSLQEERKPTRTEQEMESYVWQRAPISRPDAVAKDEPVKKDDHGLDCTRYAVMHLDGSGGGVQEGPDIWD